MSNVSNNDDVIDSRDVIERIEELTEQRQERFVAGFNMPGYMPDSDPAEFDSFEAAQRYIIESIKHDEEAAESEEDAETLCHAAEEINLQSNPFSVQILNTVYWVVQDGFMGLDEGETEELAILEAFAEEGESYAEDWKHGATLIRDSYFEDYAVGFAEDLGAIDRNASWPNTCIDWKRAAEELQSDYTSLDFDGVTYWTR